MGPERDGDAVRCDIINISVVFSTFKGKYELTRSRKMYIDDM